MTKLLTEAFRKASQLDENLQDQLAQELLDEIQWESSWDETLAKSQEKVDRLAGNQGSIPIKIHKKRDTTP